MKKKPNRDMWRIEGRSFDRVKSAKLALETARAEANKIVEAAHKELWDEIHEALPELDREANYSIDVEFERIGFYVVKESDGLKGLLGALAAKLGE